MIWAFQLVFSFTASARCPQALTMEPFFRIRPSGLINHIRAQDLARMLAIGGAPARTLPGVAKNLTGRADRFDRTEVEFMTPNDQIRVAICALSPAKAHKAHHQTETIASHRYCNFHGDSVTRRCARAGSSCAWLLMSLSKQRAYMREDLHLKNPLNGLSYCKWKLDR